VIIGLTGYKGVGKDTAGEYLTTLGYERLSFADGVRDLCEAINPNVGGVLLADHIIDVGWEHFKVWGDGRRLLDNCGKGVRDIIGEDSLVRAAARKVKPDRSYVITDLRFPNEADWVAAQGGVLWRIIRPGSKCGYMDRFVDSLACVYQINNREGIPELHRQVDQALEQTA
jgi:hypothetical protein